MMGRGIVMLIIVLLIIGLASGQISDLNYGRLAVNNNSVPTNIGQLGSTWPHLMTNILRNSSISSAKDIKANSLTFGLDKITETLGVKGLAFRLSSEDIDVGTKGSNLDANTYNITYYSALPIENDTKHIDTILGIEIFSVVHMKTREKKRQKTERNRGRDRERE